MDIQSPYPEYPGHITLPDGLLWPQLLAFADAQAACATDFTRPRIAHARICANSIDAVNGIVDWHIDRLPEKPAPSDIFVGRNAVIAGKFYQWVYNQVLRVWRNEDTVPNALSSGPTNTQVTPTETKTETQTETP
jgi:hypothetical protein